MKITETGDCQGHILRFLSKKEQLKFSRTCKQWTSIVYTDHRIWSTNALPEDMALRIEYYFSRQNFDAHVRRRENVKRVVKTVAVGAAGLLLPGIIEKAKKPAMSLGKVVKYTYDFWHSFCRSEDPTIGESFGRFGVFMVSALIGPELVMNLRDYIDPPYAVWLSDKEQKQKDLSDKQRAILAERFEHRCPLIEQVPLWPVTGPCGHVHEYRAIRQRINEVGRCPISMTVMKIEHLVIHKDLFLATRAYLAQRKAV